MPAPRTARPLGVAVLATALACGGLAIVTPAAPAAHAAPAAPAAPGAAAAGTVVLIGGGISPGEDTSDAILTEVIERAQSHATAAGRATPVVAIVSAGSPPAPNAIEAADGDEYDNASANGLYYRDWFESLGADTILVPVDRQPGEDYPGDHYSRDNAGDAALAAAITEGADAVYLGGGDQTRYVRAFMDCTAPDAAAAAVDAYTACTDTPVLAALRSVVDGGGVIAGSSAGLAIQQGAHMITGGEPYESWRDGTTPGSFDDNRLSHIPAGGFGFFTEGLIDSHFARRDRQPRIIRLALDLQQPVAYGVEEYTALVVDRATRTGTVTGDQGVSVLDVSGATFDGAGSADAVDSSYLTAGSTIDFSTGSLTLAGAPSNAPGSGAKPQRHPDLWGSSACAGDVYGTLHLAQGLVASVADRASGDSCDTAGEVPRFRTTFTRGSETAWNAAGGFTHLATTLSLIPDFAVAVSANGAAAGERPEVTAGDPVEYRITITNTGSQPLSGFQIDRTEAAAGAQTSTLPTLPTAPLAPGESFMTTVSGDTSLATLSGNVTAQPVDLQNRVIGAEVGSGTSAGAQTFAAGVTVVPKPSGPVDPSTPTDPSAPSEVSDPTAGAVAAASAQLADTGAESPIGLALAGATLLALAAAALTGTARRRRATP